MPAVQYKPEIDGLRALAIGSVFLFHLDEALLPGGFIGVDVFFVISGYLITSILWAELQAGSFNVYRFWQRRIARIAPAFFLVLLATMAVSSIVYSAQDFSSLGANSAAAALSLINVKLLLQGGYFDASPDAQPLLHYWSLAVEEQFYLVFPPLLWAIHRWARSPIVVLFALAALSLASCIALTAVWTDAAFYLLPARAWELLVGSILALLHHRGIAEGLPRRIGWLSLLTLGVASVLVSPGAQFPGWIALVPVLATAGLIASPPHILTAKPLIAVGKLSFSLYLWHWPVFSIVDYHWFEQGEAVRLFAKITITVFLAIGTHILVERPARKALNSVNRRGLALSLCASLVCASVSLGVAVRLQNYMGVFPHQIASGGRTIGNGSVHIAVIGDSQGAMHGASFVELSKRHGFKVSFMAMVDGNQLPGEKNSHWNSVEAFLSKKLPSVVVIAQAWSSKLGDARPLNEAIKHIESLGSDVIILGQPPILDKGLGREFIRNGGEPPYVEDEILGAKRLASQSELINRFGAKVIAIDHHFFDSNGSIRLIDDSGALSYQDPTHLSSTGSMIALPSIENALIKMGSASTRF